MTEKDGEELERIICLVISNIPQRVVQIIQYAETLKIQNLDDFVYGAMIDDILTRYQYYHINQTGSSNPEYVSEAQVMQMWAVIAGHAKELREAIRTALSKFR